MRWRGVDVEQVIFWLRRLAYLDVRVFEEVRSNPLVLEAYLGRMSATA